MPVDVCQPRLRTGMRTFLPHDHPHPLRLRRQDLRVEGAGDLRDPRAVRELTFGVHCGCPHVGSIRPARETRTCHEIPEGGTLRGKFPTEAWKASR